MLLYATVNPHILHSNLHVSGSKLVLFNIRARLNSLHWAGYGVIILPDGKTYEGDWVNDTQHGKGKYIWADGSIFEGSFSKGVRQGFGIWKYNNGTVYEGEFKNDFKNGKGIERYRTG